MPSALELQDPTSAAYKKAKRKFLKTTKNRPEQTDGDWTPFRAAEKKYKARFPPPDLSAVFDIAASDPQRSEEVSKGGWKGRSDAVAHREIYLDLGDGSSKRAYVFPAIPGAGHVCPYLCVLVYLHRVWNIRTCPPAILCFA